MLLVLTFRYNLHAVFIKLNGNEHRTVQLLNWYIIHLHLLCAFEKSSKWRDQEFLSCNAHFEQKLSIVPYEF